MAHIRRCAFLNGCQKVSSLYPECPPAGIGQSYCDVELFLVGKTGNGKSKTGNTILGRDRFKVSDMSQSATLKTAAGWTIRNGMTIKVVDGPGLLDTGLAGKAQLEQMEKNVSQGFVHCPNGFHALVLVLKYGNRFTDEEKKVVKLLKGMLGDDFTQRHCILAFTNGEDFLLNRPDGNFLKWCKEQQGELRELIDECCNRVVLFHNMTPGKAKDSTLQLIAMAKNLNGRYTIELFQKISEERSNFIRRQGATQLKELIQSKIDLIISYLENKEIGPMLKRVVDELEKEIDTEEKGLPVVRKVKQGIQQTRTGQYSAALITFQTIEYDGEKQLVQVYQHVLVAVGGYFEKYQYLFT